MQMRYIQIEVMIFNTCSIQYTIFTCSCECHVSRVMASDSAYFSSNSSSGSLFNQSDNESDAENSKTELQVNAKKTKLRVNAKVNSEKGNSSEGNFSEVTGNSLQTIDKEYGPQEFLITQDLGITLKGGKQKRLTAWVDVPNDGKLYDWVLMNRDGSKCCNKVVPTYDWDANNSRKRFVFIVILVKKNV